MKYDFDEVISRDGTLSVKWDKKFLKDNFGVSDVLPLWVADMDFRCAKPIIDAVKNKAKEGLFGYSWYRTEEYLDSVTGWMKRRHNWVADPEWLLFSPGIVPAIKMLIQTFSNIGDKVIVQPPVYYPFFSAVTSNGRQLLQNQLLYEDKKYSINFEDFEEKAKDPLTKIFILCSPHNPVGRVWTKKELKKLGEICLENDVLIISDEIHHDLILSNYKHTLISTLSEELQNNTILCTAPSKTFNIPGLHASNLFISDGKKRNSFTYTISKRIGVGNATIFGTVATIAAYNQGEEWLEQVLVYIENNFKFLKGYLKTNLSDLDFIDPEGTYLAWLDCKNLGMEDKDRREMLLKKAKVLLDEGPLFGLGGEGFERINVACPRTTLEECMNRITNCIKK
jgi:cystathionine beta-lyase